MHKIPEYKTICERKNKILNCMKEKAVKIMYFKGMKPELSRTKLFIHSWVYSPLLALATSSVSLSFLHSW
jgi:hypothetical protein